MTPLDELVHLLDLAPAGDDRFAAGHSQAAITTRHVFGGLVAAQAVVAAGRTVAPQRTIHSLHAYFVRRGDASLPLHLEVSRVRDGRSFSHRRVAAVQEGRAIMELSCSFAAPREGLRHEVAAPESPGPEWARPDDEVLAELPEPPPYGTTPDAFELRTVGLGQQWFQEQAPVGEPTLIWKRAAGAVPDDPLVEAAVLTYASDLRILHPVLRPHGGSMYAGDVRPATLDHAVWFHGRVRPEDWLLWSCVSPWADHGRGLVRATVHDREGRLVAEATQEGLVDLR